MLLPNYNNAFIDDEKFVKYVLNLNHPVGKHKALLFLKSFNISVDEFFI
ncbi:MAG: DUF6883 domain-containing protein [Chitinophagaceae bacterium]